MRTHPYVVTVTAIVVLLAGAGVITAASAVTPDRVLGKGLRLGCENSEAHVELYVKPRRCVVYDAERSFAGSVDLHNLRWSRWRSSGATGTGIECGFREACDNVRVKVTLSGFKRRLRCGRNDYQVFTTVKVSSRFGATKLNGFTCPGDEG